MKNQLKQMIPKLLLVYIFLKDGMNLKNILNLQLKTSLQYKADIL